MATPTDSELLAPTTPDHVAICGVAAGVVLGAIGGFAPAAGTELVMAGMVLVGAMTATLIYRLNLRLVAVLHRQRKRAKETL